MIASTQYNDWQGTVAVDLNDNLNLDDLLPSSVSLETGEFVIGFAFEFNCHGGVAYLHLGERNLDKVVFTRRVELPSSERKLDDFFVYFKRFSMVMSLDKTMSN